MPDKYSIFLANFVSEKRITPFLETLGCYTVKVRSLVLRRGLGPGLRGMSLLQVLIGALIASGMLGTAFLAGRKILQNYRTEQFIQSTVRYQDGVVSRIEQDLKDAPRINGHTGNIYFNASRPGRLTQFVPADLYDDLVILKSLNPHLRGEAFIDNLAPNGVSFDLFYVLDSRLPEVNEYFKKALEKESYVFLSSDRYRNIVELDGAAPRSVQEISNCTGARAGAICYRVSARYPNRTEAGDPQFTGNRFLGAEAAQGGTQMVVGRRVVYRVDRTSKELIREETLAPPSGGVPATVLRSEVLLNDVASIIIRYAFMPSDLRDAVGGAPDGVVVPVNPRAVRHPRDPLYYNTNILSRQAGDEALWPSRAITFSDVAALTIEIKQFSPNEFRDVPTSSRLERTQISQVPVFSSMSTKRFVYPGGASDENRLKLGIQLDPQCSQLATARCNPACREYFTVNAIDAAWSTIYRVTPEQAGNWWEPYPIGPSDYCKCGKDIDNPNTPYVDLFREGPRVPYWSPVLAWMYEGLNQDVATHRATIAPLSDVNDNNLFSGTNFNSLTNRQKRLDACARLDDCAGASPKGTAARYKHPLCQILTSCVQPSSRLSWIRPASDPKSYFDYGAIMSAIQNYSGSIDTNLSTLSCSGNSVEAFFLCDRAWAGFTNRRWDASQGAPGYGSGGLSNQNNIWRNTCACEVGSSDGVDFMASYPGLVNMDSVCGLPGYTEESNVTRRQCSYARDWASGAWLYSNNRNALSDIEKRQVPWRKEYGLLCACLHNNSKAASPGFNTSNLLFGGGLSTWTQVSRLVDPTNEGRRASNQVQAFDPDSTYQLIPYSRWYSWSWKYRWTWQNIDFRLDRPLNYSSDMGRLQFGDYYATNSINANATLPIPDAMGLYSATDPNWTRQSNWICNSQGPTGGPRPELDPRCLSRHSQILDKVFVKDYISGTVDQINNVNCMEVQAKIGWRAPRPYFCSADAAVGSVPNFNNTSYEINKPQFYNAPVPYHWPTQLAPNACSDGSALGSCASSNLQLLVNLKNDIDPRLPNIQMDLWPYRFFCHPLCASWYDGNYAPFTWQRDYIRYLFKRLYKNLTGASFNEWTDFVDWCSYSNSVQAGQGSTGGSSNP